MNSPFFSPIPQSRSRQNQAWVELALLALAVAMLWALALPLAEWPLGLDNRYAVGGDLAHASLTYAAWLGDRKSVV